MERAQQEALLEMWRGFLADRTPSGPLMREFYFDVVSYSSHYRYGMAPELFDLLVNGVFDLEQAALWRAARQAADGDHRAA